MAALTFAAIDVGSFEVEMGIYEISNALLPIIIGVVQPFGITPETVAATFLLSATMATPISPSVAAVYVGLGLADVSISEHIRYSLRLVWPASIAVLILSTLIGVIQF